VVQRRRVGDEVSVSVRSRIPEGNNDWGKDHGDARAAVNEGIPDLVKPGYSGNAIARCLTGTGPASWSLNGKESGVYDLVGNAWEWVDMLIGTTANHTIDAEYPARVSCCRPQTATSRHSTPQRRTATGPRGRRVLSGNGWLCKSRV